MTLLCELQPATGAALDSLGGKLTKGVEDLYYLYVSRQINIAGDSFIVLRRNNRIDGARFVIRPALESMLRLQAVRAKPYLLYRVLFTEARETDKWLGGVAKRHGESYTRICDREEWLAFKARCTSQFGVEKLQDTPLSSYDAAAAVGLEAYYESHYRAYCQYTHGALEAISGKLDEVIDPEDTRVMLNSAMSVLEALVGMGADCPNMESFRARFRDVMLQKPQKLFRETPT